MSIALWTVQGLLAAAFLVSGATKLSQPKEKLLKNWAWVEDFSQRAVRVIGVLEVLGVRDRAAGADGDLALADSAGGPRSGADDGRSGLTHLGRAEYGPIAVTVVLVCGAK
jgi:hypothetical protein